MLSRRASGSAARYDGKARDVTAAGSLRRGSGSDAVVAELAVEERLRPRHVALLEMLYDHLDVRVLLAEPLEVEIIVEGAEAGRGQLDLADAAEGVALERVIVADVGVLLALVVARTLDVLGVGDPDLVDSVSKTWFRIWSIRSMLCVSK